MEQKEKKKIFLKKFAKFKNNSYICTKIKNA